VDGLSAFTLHKYFLVLNLRFSCHSHVEFLFAKKSRKTACDTIGTCAKYASFIHVAATGCQTQNICFCHFELSVFNKLNNETTTKILEVYFSSYSDQSAHHASLPG